MESKTGVRLTPRRRTLLKTLGAVGGLGSLASVARGEEDEGFVLKQGDSCVPIEPLSGSVTVESLYDYAASETEYSSAGTVDLQRPDTSILFLYDGPEGVSLVVVHNELDGGGDGGSASFVFTGLPEEGEWVIQDDFYTGTTNYDQWDTDGSRSEVDWTWAADRTDGGAYRSVESADSIGIEPAFNESAELYGEYYEGTVADWQLLSGSLEDPDRVSLDLGRPVTIEAGTCDSRARASPPSAPVETVEFKGCGEVWFVFEEPFENAIAVDVETTAGWQSVDLSGDDLQRVPGQFGESPLVKWRVRGNEKILGVATSAGTTDNPHECARSGEGSGESDDGHGRGEEAEDADDDDRDGDARGEGADQRDDAGEVEEDENESSGGNGPPEDAGPGDGADRDNDSDDGDDDDNDDKRDNDSDDGNDRGGRSRGRGN